MFYRNISDVIRTEETEEILKYYTDKFSAGNDGYQFLVSGKKRKIRMNVLGDGIELEMLDYDKYHYMKPGNFSSEYRKMSFSDFGCPDFDNEEKLRIFRSMLVKSMRDTCNHLRIRGKKTISVSLLNPVF